MAEAVSVMPPLKAGKRRHTAERVSPDTSRYALPPQRRAVRVGLTHSHTCCADIHVSSRAVSVSRRRFLFTPAREEKVMVLMADRRQREICFCTLAGRIRAIHRPPFQNSEMMSPFPPASSAAPRRHGAKPRRPAAVQAPRPPPRAAMASQSAHMSPSTCR